MEYVLSAKDITKKFGGITALDKVSFHMKTGETHCLVGENGAGKSTLGKIISGIYKPTGGSIEIKNKTYTEIDPYLAMKLKIAIVTQELNLMPDLSIAENIYMLEKSSYRNGFLFDRKKIKKKTELLLNQYGIKEFPDVSTKVKNITPAQAQLVEIMKAAATNSDIMIFDEPTTSLAHGEVEKLFNLIRLLKSRGVSIVLVTHRFSEIFEIGELVTVLCDARIVSERIPITELDSNKLIKLMTGRTIRDFYGKKEEYALGNTLISTKNISDGVKIQNISFSARRGEIVGFAGLMGSGRTEIMETIFGIRKLTSGELILNYQKLDSSNIKNRIKQGIVMVPEDRKQKGLAVNLSIKSNINHVNTNLKKGFWIHEGLFPDQDEKICRKLAIKVGDINDSVSKLSGGNQQKVLLAKWLAQDTLVYIFDEPTRGIDVGTKVEIYKLIRELAKNNHAILIVSSELQELIALCHRIYVVSNGRITAELSGDDATEQTILKKAITHEQ